jgi:hypothetical protein
MATYSGYITEVRRLLHDAAGNFWTDTELADYINDARERVVRDTGCLRTIQSYTILNAVETLSYAALPQANRTIDVLNVNLYWGNTRIPLRYLAWSQFNAELRFWQNYTGRPVAFSIYGQQTIYFGPIPDQNYQIEVDTVILPEPLTSNSSIETILDPYTKPVKYYAAHTAKYKEQSYGEAEIFKAQYEQQVKAALTSTMTRRLPTPYSIPY